MIMKSDILFIQFLKKGKVSRMLALSRKKDEAIIINDDVEVTVIEIKGDQVKLGITAPKSVRDPSRADRALDQRRLSHHRDPERQRRPWPGAGRCD